MLDIDHAVIQNILLVVPFRGWSPLFDTPQGQEGFMKWCADDPVASHLVTDSLAEAPVFELDHEENAFVLSVDYMDAENLVRTLVTAYEDDCLDSFFRNST